MPYQDSHQEDDEQLMRMERMQRKRICEKKQVKKGQIGADGATQDADGTTHLFTNDALFDSSEVLKGAEQEMCI